MPVCIFVILNVYTDFAEIFHVKSFLVGGRFLTKNLSDPKFLINPFLMNFLEKYVKYKVTNLSYRWKQLEASGEVAILLLKHQSVSEFVCLSVCLDVP